MEQIKGIELLNLKIILEEVDTLNKFNAEEYVKELFIKKGFQFLKYKKETGCPDFCFFDGVKRFFVEVKTNGDGLRYEQFKWIKDNPNKEVIVFLLKQNEYKTDLKEIHRKRISKDKEREDLRKALKIL